MLSQNDVYQCISYQNKLRQKSWGNGCKNGLEGVVPIHTNMVPMQDRKVLGICGCRAPQNEKRYSAQQELSRSGILIHTTPFEYITGICCIYLNSIESPLGPWVCLEFSLSGSAWGYAPNVSLAVQDHPNSPSTCALSWVHTTHHILSGAWWPAEWLRKAFGKQ